MELLTNEHHVKTINPGEGVRWLVIRSTLYSMGVCYCMPNCLVRKKVVLKNKHVWAM